MSYMFRRLYKLGLNYRMANWHDSVDKSQFNCLLHVFLDKFLIKDNNARNVSSNI